MYYVAVLVSDASYHGNEALTYSSQDRLHEGTIVLVTLRNKQVIGVVTSVTTTKPIFTTKPIIEAFDLPPLPKELIKIAWWLAVYYATPLGVAVQQILPKELPKKPDAPFERAKPVSVNMPPLTSDQQHSLDNISGHGLHILHGDTGTGKTRIYIELVKRAVDQGKSALVITPEIGLTSQLAENLGAVFSNRVVIIHSQLTEATRRKIWLNMLKEGEPLVVVGPRSALFSPLHSLGAVIIDEAHETAYKQDKSPYYHASLVASMLASSHNATVVLGSATPLVSDYYIAQQKKRPILRMTQTAIPAISKRGITIVDLRDRSLFTKKSPLSDKLIEQVRETLSRKEQVLLFLNRRGTARVIMCEACGWQALCPHCDLPLIYHNDTHSVRCHTCNFSTRTPTVCSECSNTSVLFKSMGTKAIADEAQKLFPAAKVMRFDNDNKKEERIENHYTQIKQGDVDILVGTQTLAKGLDLPGLGLVGVVMADSSLYVPDFSSQERTFQLLSQVIGRVGRGHRDSQVFIQTYNPDSPLLRSIVHKDWSSFYNHELAEREQFLFPPFCFLMKVWCRRATQQSAQAASTRLAEELQRSGLHITVEGPAPAFHEKVAGKYQWQLIIKAKQRQQLLDAIVLLPSGWSHDIDPMNLL